MTCPGSYYYFQQDSYESSCSQLMFIKQSSITFIHRRCVHSCGTVWVLQERGHVLTLNVKMNEEACTKAVNAVVLKV